MSDLAFRYERRGAVRWIYIERPQTRNAMSARMWSTLHAAIDDVARDPACRALVVTGVADAFVSGADIGDFARFADPAADGVAYEATVEAALRALEALDAVTVAAISGACTGGGAVLAAACDLRVATADARFGVPIARTVGNMTSAANVARLTALVGPALVAELIFTAKLIDANRAHDAGFVGEIVPDRATLLERAQALAESIAANAPSTVRAAKETLRRLRASGGAPVDDRDVLARAYGSDDFREGVAAFVGKRAARWTGR